jgi:hypothetical protein
MREFDSSRRSLLRFGATAAVGIVTAEAAIPLKIEVNKTVQEATGLDTGNAGMRNELPYCEETVIDEACKPHTIKDAVDQVILAPVLEEAIFRAAPSAIISRGVEGEENAVIEGTGGLGMTRRELFVGAVSSVGFAASHNILSSGVDTKTVPASQAVGGMVYWYLQRKFGFPANTIAHSWNNARL